MTKTIKKCMNCKEVKQTITKRSNLCIECFEGLMKAKIKGGGSNGKE
jgi:hypothetical protein